MFRHKSWRKPRTALIMAALTLLTSACSASDDGATSTSSVRQESPLDEYLSLVWGSNLSVEERQRQFDEEAIRREDLVAQCMREGGFEYLPNLGASQLFAVDDSRAPFDDPDWVAQFGYGGVVSPPSEHPPAPPDPNLEHLSELTAAEREAWHLALNGNWVDLVIAGEGLSHWELMAHAGCVGNAQIQLRDERPEVVASTVEFAPLFDAINQMQSDLLMEVTDADRD